MKNEQTTEAKIKNFTPLLDELVQKYGVITAAVWGRVWRYAQQENHVCNASLDKIAGELNISVRTVIRHMQVLVANGYLFDHTPGIKNIPHTYGITQKARILITVEGVTESHTGMTQSPDGYDRKSHEETIKENSTVARKSRTNPLSNHPAILCVKGITNRYPPRANYQKVIEVLGDTPDGERAASCYEEWTFRGYNGNSLGWLDWYVNGIPTRGGKQNGNGHGAPNAQIKQAPAKQDEGKGMYL